MRNYIGRSQGDILEMVHQKAQDLKSSSSSSMETTNETIKPNTNDSNTAANTTPTSKIAATITTPSKYSGNTLETKKKKKNIKFSRTKPTGYKEVHDVTSHSNTLRQCRHIPNLYTYHGSISSYAANFSKEGYSFDIGVALHACGEATDQVLRACGKNQNASFIVSPCCVGKLNRFKSDPYIYHSTAGNEPTITYPQSSIFGGKTNNSVTTLCGTVNNDSTDCPSNRNQINTAAASANISQQQFDILAKAADYSDLGDMRTCRNATRRTAKSLLEMDRLLYMKETFGYDHVVLTRMDPWEATPKNDILMGWMDENTARANDNRFGTSSNILSNTNGNEKGMEDGTRVHRAIQVCGPYDSFGDGKGIDDVVPCADCIADIEMAIRQLIGSPPSSSSRYDDDDKRAPLSNKNSDYEKDQTKDVSTTAPTANKCLTGDTVDWTKKEEESYLSILNSFVAQSANNTGNDPEQLVKRFPTGMTSRERKLIHYVAGKMGLRHWCERVVNKKIVVVAAKRDRS